MARVAANLFLGRLGEAQRIAKLGEEFTVAAGEREPQAWVTFVAS